MVMDTENRDDAQQHCHCHRCECHTHDGDDAPAKFLHLAKCAKHSLLKQKIEKQIEAKIGEKLDRIAVLAVEALIDHMSRASATEQAARRYEEELRAILAG